MLLCHCSDILSRGFFTVLNCYLCAHVCLVSAFEDTIVQASLIVHASQLVQLLETDSLPYRGRRYRALSSR